MTLPTTLRDRLDESTTRAELEQMLVNRAVNDAAFWTLLTDPATTRQALTEFFGAAPPPELEVQVHVEGARRFCHVVPHPEYAEPGIGPATLAPRENFKGRLNHLLHTDPEFKARFEAHPPAAIAEAFDFRFPAHVEVAPLVETASLIHIVLPHASHNSLFNSPYAVSFNGVDAGVAVAGSESLRFGAALTVETWVKARRFNAGNWQDAIVSMHGDANGWELRVGQGIPRFMVTVGGVHHYAQPQDSGRALMEPDRWYYLAGVYDGATLRLFMNGKQLYEPLAVSGEITNASGGLTLGRNSNPDWDQRFFDGYLDEVRIWARATDEAEIAANRPRKTKLTTENDPDLRAHYDMSEGNGPVLHDASGHGNVGALVKAEWVATGIDSAP